jgi:hypothetical protein
MGEGETDLEKKYWSAAAGLPLFVWVADLKL